MTDENVVDLEQKRKRKPKPTKNPDAGEVACSFCQRSAPVRKNANGKFYYNCPHCGIVQPALPAFQEWVLEHATLYGPEGKPERAPQPQPEPDTREETKTEKTRGAEVAGRGEIIKPAPSQAAVAPAKSTEKPKRHGLRLFK